MKTTLLHLGLFAALTATAQNIQFEDGSTLKGQLHSISPDGSLLWASPVLKAPAAFKLSALDSCQIQSPKSTASAQGAVRLFIADSSESLPIELLSFQDGMLQVSINGQPHTLKKQNFSQLSFSAAPVAPLISLPTTEAELAKWGNNAKLWELADGMLRPKESSQSPISANCILPGRFTLRLALTPTEENYGTFSLSLKPLKAVKPAGNAKRDIQRSAAPLSISIEEGAAIIEIATGEVPLIIPCVNMNELQLHIDLDNNIACIGTATSLQTFPIPKNLLKELRGAECRLGIVCHSASAEQAFSALSIEPWDGILQGNYVSASSGTDSIHTRDGQSLNGTLISIDQAQATLESAYGTLSIPRSNINAIFFAQSDALPTAPAKPDDKSAFVLLGPHGLKLTCSSITYQDAVFSLTHPSLGQFSLPSSAVSRLGRPGIEKPKENSDRDSNHNRALQQHHMMMRMIQRQGGAVNFDILE